MEQTGVVGMGIARRPRLDWDLIVGRGSGGTRRKALKARLFEEQKGLCFYCGRSMRLEWEHQKRVKVPEDLATLDHRNSRLSSSRGKSPGVKVNVLACWKCNFNRGKAEEELVFRNDPEEIWRRSRSYPD